jgi:hypothetical protein
MTRVVAAALGVALIATTLFLAQRGGAFQRNEEPGSATVNNFSTTTQDPPQQGAPQQDEEPEVTVLSSQTLNKSTVISRLASLTNSDDEIKALSANLVREGFKAQAKPENHFGSETFYWRPDGQTAKVTILLQDYTKDGSADQAAVGTITIIARDRSDTYSFSVIAPGGNFENVSEHKVNETTLSVERAHSLWSCFVNRVRSKCTNTCASSLFACTAFKTWSAYLGCLAIRCGGCAAKAFGCCACDNRWWCRWAAGSCHQ